LKSEIGDLKLKDAARAPGVISPETLARLWPNRVHESNWLKSLACEAGFHRWQEMKFEGFAEGKAVRSCRWCAKVKARRDAEAEAD
jgi:hypothetical protein